jgi:nucleotide-binding universal stress UspA family protein
MPRIEHILFPYDFSRPCALVAPQVRAVACRFGAKVTLFTVYPTSWDNHSPEMPTLKGLDTPEEELKALLAPVAASMFAGIPVEIRTAMGEAAFKIVQFAHDHHVDLIMMPTHGFGTFRSLLIGSVTAKVLHESKCPVWTAAHAQDQASSDLPLNILCAIDRTKETAPVMKWAGEYSQKMGGTLRLLHVVEPISDCLSLPSERRLQEEIRSEASTQVEALRRKAGVDATFSVAVGKLTETVTEEARREQANLVVIGRGSLNSTLGALHTHAYGIIQGSPCPVLSV